MSTIWPLVTGITAAAGCAAALSLPTARRATFGSVNFEWLANELEIDSIDADRMTVRTKSDTLFRVYELEGMAYDTMPEGEQTAWHDSRASFLHEVAHRGVTIRLFGLKRLRAVHYPAVWPSVTLEEIGKQEAALYASSFSVSWFLVLQARTFSALEEADEKLHTGLATYRPARLTRPYDPAQPCPLTGFLNFLLCGENRDDLPAPSRNVSANLPAADLVFQSDGLIQSVLSKPLFQRIIAVRQWSDTVSGHILHELLALPAELEVCQIGVPQPREKAMLLLKRASETTFGSAQAAKEAVVGYELLSQGNTSVLATQLQVTIRATTISDLDAVTAQVMAIFGKRRITASVETRGAPVAWFNRMPERERLLRPLKLFCENVAAVWPFESSPTGLDRSQYGDAPIRSLKTGSGQNYAFQFQNSVEDQKPGHFVVFAPTGVGKSTLVLHLLGGLAKFPGVRSYVFDSKEGARYMVEALGGVYQSFEKLAFNPLDTEDTPVNRQRLVLLVKLMLGAGSDDPALSKTIEDLLTFAFKMDPDHRTFSKIFDVSFEKQSDARTAFAKWVTDGKGRVGLYSNIFNSPQDSLASFLSSSFLTGINMNEALENPDLGAPVVAHISNALERMARSGDGRGFVVFIDEAANLLRNVPFRQQVAVMFREYRRLRGSVGLAFQDPGALFETGIASAVIENASTFFFYPNPQGNREAFEKFNLNDEQKKFIFSAPEGRKVLLLKRDPATGLDESVILDIDLAPLGKALRFYKSGPDSVRLLETLQNQWGDQWLNHL